MTGSADFQTLFQQGKRIDRPSLILLWRPAEQPTRVGFAVSRQVRGAVRRNRARRRLREAYRGSRAAAPARAAIVVIGRPVALTVPLATLVAELRHAFGEIPASAAGP